MKFPVQIVNNYQSLTIATKTHIPRNTSNVDPPLNLILIKKITTMLIKHLLRNFCVADSLEVRFRKFARAVFRKTLRDLHSLRSLRP